MELDLKRLRSAVAVAEEGNLSRAAVRLHVSQPALSRRIQELEKDLRFALFEPAGRGIRLTGEGKAFLNQCRDLLSHAEAAEDRARSFASGERGIVRFGATTQILERLYPKLLSRYRARFPLVEVEPVEDNQTNLRLLLERGEVNLATIALPANERIECRILAPISVLAACTHTQLLSGAAQLEIEKLNGAPVLLPDEGFKSRQLFDAACRLAHIEPRIVLESGAPQTILTLAEAGLGIAIVPSTIRIERPALHAAPLVHNSVPLEMKLAIGWNRDRYLAPYAEGFIEEVSNIAREEFAS